MAGKKYDYDNLKKVAVATAAQGKALVEIAEVIDLLGEADATLKGLESSIVELGTKAVGAQDTLDGLNTTTTERKEVLAGINADIEEAEKKRVSLVEFLATGFGKEKADQEKLHKEELAKKAAEHQAKLKLLAMELSTKQGELDILNDEIAQVKADAQAELERITG